MIEKQKNVKTELYANEFDYKKIINILPAALLFHFVILAFRFCMLTFRQFSLRAPFYRVSFAPNFLEALELFVVANEKLKKRVN